MIYDQRKTNIDKTLIKLNKQQISNSPLENNSIIPLISRILHSILKNETRI
jgi:hypothetical protein